MKLNEKLLPIEREQLNALTNRLATLESIQLGDLLFGKPGQNYRVISLERPLQVVQIQHLQIPKGDPHKNESVTDKLSRSILVTLGAFAKSMMHSDREVFKIYMLDEASSMLKIARVAVSPIKSFEKDVIITWGCIRGRKMHRTIIQRIEKLRTLG